MGLKSLIILILLGQGSVIAQSVVFFSPGVKLGYAFGEKEGFIWGIEGTIVFGRENRSNDTRYGIALSLESFKGKSRLHIGGQANFAGDINLFGIEIGPTIILDEEVNDFGISFTPYYGAFLIPYVRFTSFQKTGTEAELGTFLKLHLRVKGEYHLEL